LKEQNWDNALLFWDVDTQEDFILPHGKLPAENALEIVPNLKRLTQFAREKKYPIVMSMDSHELSDPEISQTPDFLETFPPHCLMGTKGWEKIPETQPENPLYIDPVLIPHLKEKLQSHKGEIILKKNKFDVFSNPNTKKIVKILNPKAIVVYGVTTEVCCRYAVEGLLKLGKKVIVVEDAMKPIRKEGHAPMLSTWKAKGAAIMRTHEICRE
jgi:nicotinamidase/pyrazinamidase